MNYVGVADVSRAYSGRVNGGDTRSCMGEGLVPGVV